MIRVSRALLLAGIEIYAYALGKVVYLEFFDQMWSLWEQGSESFLRGPDFSAMIVISFMSYWILNFKILQGLPHFWRNRKPQMTRSLRKVGGCFQ